MTTHITIKLFATLKKYSPPDAEKYPLTPGNTLKDLVESLGMSEDEAKIIFIDGVKANLDSGLQGGETVSIFPPIGGG
jgi:molybdopterin converting factor small subunit